MKTTLRNGTLVYSMESHLVTDEHSTCAAAARQLIDHMSERQKQLMADFLSVPDITVGSVVRLKSGGPMMTVLRIKEGGDSTCMWISGDRPVWIDAPIAALEPAGGPPLPHVA